MTLESSSEEVNSENRKFRGEERATCPSPGKADWAGLGRRDIQSDLCLKDAAEVRSDRTVWPTRGVKKWDGKVKFTFERNH